MASIAAGIFVKKSSQIVGSLALKNVAKTTPQVPRKLGFIISKVIFLAKLLFSDYFVNQVWRSFYKFDGPHVVFKFVSGLHTSSVLPGGHTWYPDADYFKEYSGKVTYMAEPNKLGTTIIGTIFNLEF